MTWSHLTNEDNDNQKNLQTHPSSHSWWEQSRDPPILGLQTRRSRSSPHPRTPTTVSGLCQKIYRKPWKDLNGGPRDLISPRHGLLRWCSGKESICQCRRCKRCGFNPWVGKISWSRKWQPTPVFFLENSLERGAWWATVHGAIKSQTWLIRGTDRGRLDLPTPFFFPQSQRSKKTI